MEVKLLERVELAVVQDLVSLETDAFGSGGLNEWHLVPLIRHGRVFVAWDEGKPVGMIQYMRDWSEPDKVYVFGISIIKERRGQGLGTTLMETSLKRLQEEQVRAVELTVDPGNKGAIAVYTKLGFKSRETRMNEYGAGEDRLVMVLPK